MQIANLIPELKHIIRNFILFLIISPIIGWGLMRYADFFKKYWQSGSRLKKWYILTLSAFTACIAFIGL